MGAIPKDKILWMTIQGPQFLKSLDIKKGDVVLDLGCNEGHYTIPLAKVVSSEGKVYALDKSDVVLRRLKKHANRLKLFNIEFENTGGSVELKFPDKLFDAVFTFDVLHYIEESDRKKLYREIYRVLKQEGRYFVYPKHNRDDWPMWALSSKSIEAIKSEILESAPFAFMEKKRVRLLHDDWFEWGDILIFKRS